MATEEEPDSLKIYWDHFFKAETGTYEVGGTSNKLSIVANENSLIY